MSSTLRPAAPTAVPGPVEFIVLFSLVTSLTAISIDAMLPALRAIGHDLGVVDPVDTQLVVSMFVLGTAFGDLVFGPISDAIGRKKAILLGLLIYAGGTALAWGAASLEVLLLGRVIQGIGVSGPKIASRALIRDRFEGAAMARIMSLIFMVFILVPMIAPAMGQLIVALADWRAIFLVYLVWAAFLSLWLAWRQPETLPPERRIPFSPAVLLRNSSLVIRHPKVMAYALAGGAIFGAILLYVGMAQAIFLDLFGIDRWFPACFAALAFGIGLASFVNSRLVVRLGMHRIVVAALAGLIGLSAIMLAVGAVGGGVPPFPVFMVLCFLMFCCFGLLFGNINALAMVSLGRVAGLGASIVSALAGLIAFICAASLGRLYNATIFPFATGFLVAAAIALVAVLYAQRSQAGAV